MPGTIISEHGIPGALRVAVVDTLDAYDQDCGRKGRDELMEAVARVQHQFREDIEDIDADGPVAAADGLLVYAISRSTWYRLCREMSVFDDAEEWARECHRHAADRAARADPHVSLDHVRDHYSGDDRRAIVVGHP